jgi:hypothetical protein
MKLYRLVRVLERALDDRHIARLSRPYAFPPVLFLTVRSLRDYVFKTFYETPLGKRVDADQHEHNMRELAKRWQGKDKGGNDWKEDVIATHIETRTGRSIFTERMVSPLRRVA